MRKDGKGSGEILSTITIFVLFAVILILVVFSASSYRNGNSQQSDNDNKRAILSYVITAVKTSSADTVEPAEFDGAPGIVLRETDKSYEQRIYMHGGKLLVEYVRSDIPADPANAFEIGSINSFEASYIRDGLLEVKTDLGTTYINTGAGRHR